MIQLSDLEGLEGAERAYVAFTIACAPAQVKRAQRACAQAHLKRPGAFKAPTAGPQLQREEAGARLGP